LRFIPDHLLQYVFSGLKVIPLPVKDARCFITGFVHVVLKVHMVKAFFNRIAFVRVENKHLSE